MKTIFPKLISSLSFSILALTTPGTLRAQAEESASTPGLQPGGPNPIPFIDVSAIGTFAAGASTEQDLERLQPGGHDPYQRGFNLQSLELDLRANVDPYFRAQSNLIFAPDAEGHGDGIEIEEAYLETIALPANLQVRAGQFFTEFGQFNTKHLHQWDFVDQPLVINRMFGPDGLRNPGARVSWLAPTPFFSELFFTVQQSSGETAYSFRNGEGFAHSEVFFRGSEIDEERAAEVRNPGDLLYSTRYAASWDPAETQTLLAGTSAAFGPNAGTEDSSAGRTEIYGADLTWHWTPVDQVRGFPFVTLRTEGLYRRFGMEDPGESFEDYGIFVEALYGFTPGWVAGLRYDGVRGDLGDAVDADGDNLGLGNRSRVSPNITWYPSEFSKLRLQYNYDDQSGFGTDHTVWLQWEFSIGPHAAHTF